MKRLLFVMSAIVAMVTTVAAQNMTVKGAVSDIRTGEPLPYVNVGLMRMSDTVFVRGAATDIDGVFQIKDVTPGSYLLQASIVGYDRFVKTLDVHNDLDNVDIKLKGGTLLETVEIVAERPLYVMDGEKNMYNAKEDPSIQTGTASDALQNAPGVEVDAEGNITLRGVSSVEIWINDRPSHMNQEALKQYIKQLPANAIERIEVITNPSARYSTSGGVINIVTNQKITRNELLCVGVRARTSPNVSPWASYVWANEKVDFNFYLNADYSHHKMEGDGSSTLFDANGDTSRYQHHETTGRSKNIGGYTGLNLNWNISGRTHLSTWIGLYPYWGSNRNVNDFEYKEYKPDLRDLGYRYDFRNEDGFGWGGYAGAWFEHRFDTTGRKLSFSFNSNTWNNDGWGYETFAYRDPLRDTLMRRTYSDNSNPSGSLTLNYTHPLRNGFELEVGAEMEFGGGRRCQRLDTLASGSYVQVSLRSYEGEERGTGLNGYLTLQKRWGGFTAKLGMRGEQAWKHSTWNYLDGTGAVRVDTAFFGLVPSVHLSYQTKTFTSYSLSYTRRFSTPGMTQLSTFRRFDDYGFETGNPALLISYTHNVEAAFNKYLMGFGNIGFNAYFRSNTDEIGSMTYAGYAPEYFGSLLVNYTCPENIGSSHTEGVEANITYRPTGLLNVRFNASVFNYGYAYNGFTDSKVSWSARLNVWAKLWGWLEVFANARYSSPRMGLYSLSVANKSVDFGVSSDFFNRKLSVFFNVNDIFGMAEWGSNTTAPSYQTTGSQRYDSRFVSLGLTWRIGKMELESKARQGVTENAGAPRL
ncbi:MAG: TonB-dependent receptor plug [bacterium P3]|nr:MAG: TonB-dependent receptor plug [bacterium P3]KWW34148.1 MAG: TonB-dependent receptor plug [bacterium F083]